MVHRSTKTPAQPDFRKLLTSARKKRLQPIGRITAEQLAVGTFEPVEWLVENLILKGAVNMFWGWTGTGKTTWITQVAAAIAAGESEIFGRKLLPARALLFLTEDDPTVLQTIAQQSAAAVKADLGKLPFDIVNKEVPKNQPALQFRLATINKIGEWQPGPYFDQLIVNIEASRKASPNLHLLITLDAIEQFPGGAYGIAVHEAGHAIAQYRLGYEFHNVEFTPNGWKGLVGVMQPDDPDDPFNDAVLEDLNTPSHQECLIITLAGPVAQAIHSGWELITGPYGLGLDDVSRWPRAAEAMLTLERDTYELVRRHWNEILRIADMLQECGELSFDEFVEYLDIRW